MFYLITKSYEYSSDRLMDWLYLHSQHVVRFNTDDLLSPKINISNEELDNKFIIRKVSYVNSNKNFEQNIFNYYRKEIFEYWVELINKYQKNIVFGSSVIREPYRIKTLEIAKKCKFLVPDYIITSSKNDLMSFKKKIKR